MLQIAARRLPKPVLEHRFAPPRRWRFDLAWPDKKLAAEIHGGVWRVGRHNRGAGFTNDREKTNQAILMGWRVFEFTSAHVQNGYAIRILMDVL